MGLFDLFSRQEMQRLEKQVSGNAQPSAPREILAEHLWVDLGYELPTVVRKIKPIGARTFRPVIVAALFLSFGAARAWCADTAWSSAPGKQDAAASSNEQLDPAVRCPDQASVTRLHGKDFPDGAVMPQPGESPILQQPPPELSPADRESPPTAPAQSEPAAKPYEPPDIPAPSEQTDSAGAKLPPPESGGFNRALGAWRASTALGEGRLDEAEKLYHEVLRNSASAQQRDRYYAACLSGLGRIHMLRDHLSEAEKLLTQAIEIFESEFGVDHPFAAESMSNLGSVRFAQGRHAEAEKVWTRTLAIFEKAFGKENPFVAGTLSNLGDVYRATGKLAEAENHYQRALALNEKLLGSEDRGLVVTLTHLAGLYTDADRTAEAEPLLERALKILDKTGFRRKVPADNTLADLGQIRLGQGRLAEGETLLKEAWEIRLREYGRESNAVLDAEYQLALSYLRQAKYAEAEPLFRRLLEHGEKTAGPQSPVLFPLVHWLATIDSANGRYDAAEAMFQRALAVSRAGPNRDFTKSICLTGLAGLARRRERYEEAAAGYRQSLVLLQKSLPADSLIIIDALLPLALTLETQGQTAEAERLRTQWRAGWRKDRPLKPPDTWRQIAARAAAYLEDGQASRAEAAYWLAFRYAVIAHGPDHPDVQALCGKLAQAVRVQGRQREVAALKWLAAERTQE